MRTAKITLNNKEYLLCFSTRVIRSCAERYGSVDGIDAALSEGDQLKKLDESIWLLSAMLDGGARYAKLNGIDNPPAPTFDDLYDICDISDFSNLKSKIQETITNGKEASVNIEASKNVIATPTA